MKKTLIISMLLVLGISFAFAQGNYGVRAGLNLSNFEGDGNQDNKIGFHAGFMMDYPVHSLIRIQPELTYTQRGNHSEVKLLGTTIKTDNLLHYVELPIFLKASIALASDNFKVEPYVGPELRYLVKGTKKIKGGSNESSGDYDKDDINAFDYGVGFGLDFRINRDMLLGARYSMGMAEVFKNANSKNTAIMVNLGYSY